MLRCYDNGEAPDGTIEAEPVDVTLALTIMDTVRAHALVVLASLSAKGLKSPSDFAIKAEKQAEARRLRAIPMSLQKIADRLEESKTTIARWVK